MSTLDLLVRGATVVNGDFDAQPYRADIAVQGDAVAAVGHLPSARARRIIEADGAIACPGLIDPHSHSDWTVLANPTAESTIRQGVTTEVVGNCGVTYAPLSDASAPAVAHALAAVGCPEPVRWRSFGELLEQVRNQGTSQNLAWFVGHSALRDAAGVGRRRATYADTKAMTRLLDEALDAGALGMSTGLEYGSGRAATTGELVALARGIGRRGGMYASHIRNRDAGLASAIDEFFEIARATSGPAQLSHLNVRHDTGAPPNGWYDAVDTLSTERDRGMPVLADMTPLSDGMGLATGILPDWFLDDGPERAAALLADQSVRQRLRTDCDRYWRFIHRGQWDRVTLQNSPATPQWEGLTMPEIAHRTGLDEWDAFFNVLLEAGTRLGSVTLAARLFTDEHVAEAISHPLFCLGVDGFTSRIDGPLADRSRHPLFFSGHVHYLAHHVRDAATLTLATAIHKMTGMVADQFGLSRRGRLRPGDRADLVVFDLSALHERSSVANPHVYPTGIQHVLVNGVSVIDGGEHTGARPGRYLTRQ